MVVDVPDLRRQEVEVVEQPFRRGGNRLAGADIVGQRSIRIAQHAGVVIEPGEDIPGAAPGVRVDGEARGEGQRALFQPLDAEQLVAKRLIRRRRAPVPELPEESAHHARCPVLHTVARSARV